MVRFTVSPAHFPTSSKPAPEAELGCSPHFRGVGGLDPSPSLADLEESKSIKRANGPSHFELGLRVGRHRHLLSRSATPPLVHSLVQENRQIANFSETVSSFINSR